MCGCEVCSDSGALRCHAVLQHSLWTVRGTKNATWGLLRPFLDTVVMWDRALRRQLDLLYRVLMIDGQIWSIAGQIISRIKPTFYRNTLQLTCGIHLWDGRGMWHVWRRASYKVLVGEPVVKRPRLRPSHRLEDNIKKCNQEIGWEDVDGTDVAQDRAK